jgi:5-methylcytosine-specific restriction endonuclease McrA
MERRKLTNDALVRQLDTDVARERGMTIDVLHDLNEMARRRLHLDLGYRSLFDYCTRKLKYSSSAAARRIQAARCIRLYPVVLKMLEADELSLTTISSIASILTPQNCTTILERLRGLPSRKVERIACEYRPPVAFRDQTRPVRVITPGAGSELKQFAQFLADDEFVALLEEVRALLSRDGHYPSMAEVLKVALKEYRDRHSPIARHERRERKNGATTPDSRRREWKDATKSREDATKSRHIAADMRDAVFARDGGRCTFVSRDGTRCESRLGLQIDHIHPFAIGGTHDLSNLRLLCDRHNRRAAEIVLGSHVMQRYWRPA